MAGSIYEAQRRYADNQKKRGMVRVNTFVPEEYSEELKNIAAAMRSGVWGKRR